MRSFKSGASLMSLLTVLATKRSLTQAFPVVRSLPSLASNAIATSNRCMASVTGTAYESDVPDAPKVKLFTKEGCTLCDKVKDVLIDVRSDHPHSLEQIDITDAGHEEWYSKYKYDIPVLHVDGQFWNKHRITKEEAVDGLLSAQNGKFEGKPGEPDAGAMEARQAARDQNQ